MPQELINILIQLPVVALFIWFFDRMTVRFESNIEKQAQRQEAFLREERAARDKVLSEILYAIREVKEKLDDHDQKVETKINSAIDKTASQVSQTKPRQPRS